MMTAESRLARESGPAVLTMSVNRPREALPERGLMRAMEIASNGMSNDPNITRTDLSCEIKSPGSLEGFYGYEYRQQVREDLDDHPDSFLGAGDKGIVDPHFFDHAVEDHSEDESRDKKLGKELDRFHLRTFRQIQRAPTAKAAERIVAKKVGKTTQEGFFEPKSARIPMTVNGIS